MALSFMVNETGRFYLNRGRLYSSSWCNVADRVYVERAFEQNSEAWHAWRFEGIGASDAPVILETSPFKTPEKLLRQKREHIRVVMTPVMARGLAMEPRARADYIARVGFKVEPLCIESVSEPWARASLDGISADRQRAVEIKCGEGTYKQARKGRIPPYYVAQLQHQLFVSGLSSIDYFSWAQGRKAVLITVERDDAFIAEMIKKERRFFELMQRAA